MTSFTSFTGIDPPVDRLPTDFKTAILHSQTETQTPADNNVIGSALSGSGYCAQDKFKQQLYCACVNAPTANPECIFTDCANQIDAYKTTHMQKVMNNAEKLCPSTVNCTQVFDMGGSSNIASGVQQTMNCGGVVETFVTNIQAHPFLAIVILIFILSVVMFVSDLGKKSSGPSNTLPPPELIIPTNL